MKALVLHELDGPLVLEEVPRPVPGSGEVVVRVRACGLGLTLAWNRKGRRDPGRLPRIIGHEIAGDVAEVGPLVDAVAVGERVAVYFYLTCGVCRWCERGRENLCDRRGQIGREIDGGLAEYVRVPARNVCRVPANVGDVEAAVTADAVATAVHVLRGRAQTEPGETVVVVGAGGGVGIHMVQIAKMLGARVIAVDIHPDKLDLARSHGADEVVDGAADGFMKEVHRLTGNQGADIVVELVGLEQTLEHAAASLGKGGRLVLVGSYDHSAILTLTQRTLLGEQSVLGSQYCTRSELEQALELVEEGRIRPVVTVTCGLEAADTLLRRVERMEVAGRACVVLP